MLDIQKNALTRLLSVLGSLKAEYKIILPDGTSYGELEVKAAPEPTAEAAKRPRVHPWGERAEYVKLLIADMMPTDVRQLPTDVYDQKTLASAVSSTASRLWGTGSYMVVRTADGKHVEILRQF